MDHATTRGRGRPRQLALAWGAVALAAGCGNARPIADDSGGCPNWTAGDLQTPAPLVGAIFASRCAGCHAGSLPAGNYDLSAYPGVLGVLGYPAGTGARPDAIAGDPTSRLVEILDPDGGDPGQPEHADLADLLPVVRQWVGTCRLSYAPSAVHPGGWANPADPDGGFHGVYLATHGWSFDVCQKCHGTDFSGGAAQTSCVSCHRQGPLACDTCHGQPPADGAHVTHVEGGVLGKQFGCSECHVLPAMLADAGGIATAITRVGHLVDDAGVALTTAPLSFGPLAATSDESTTRQGPPAFDSTTTECSNVYCHGGAFSDAKATNTRPRWNLPHSGQAACGSCHGLPPSDHGAALTQCAACHPRVVEAACEVDDGVYDGGCDFVDGGAGHLTGSVWRGLGNGSRSCTACHGDPAHGDGGDAAAPPLDVEGHRETTFPGVGAHQAHLAAHVLRGPVACGDCHLVPATPGSPGHVDHDPPATLFPVAIAATSLAFAWDAGPSYDPGTTTCSATYCHGGGSNLSADASVTLHRHPVWTSVGVGEASCGTCHGIPPLDGVPGHAFAPPAAALASCHDCHASSVDAAGNVLVAGGTSAHMNGCVDVVSPDGGLDLHLGAGCP